MGLNSIRSSRNRTVSSVITVKMPKAIKNCYFIKHGEKFQFLWGGGIILAIKQNIIITKHFVKKCNFSQTQRAKWAILGCEACCKLQPPTRGYIDALTYAIRKPVE